MNRKRFAVGIFLILVGAGIIPITAQDIGTSMVKPSDVFTEITDVRHSRVFDGGFGLESVICVSWDANETHEPLQPGGASRSINLTVTYYTVRYHPILGRIILLYCLLSHQFITIKCEIEDLPSWCTASLSDNQLRFPISGKESSQIITLTVAVNEHAPAYSLCWIPINMSIETVQGPFGILPFVSGFDNTFSLNLQPGYLPHIIVEPESDSMNVTSGENSILSINITNHGNARTVVLATVIDRPGNDWKVIITDMITLDENMTGIAYLAVCPPSNFSGTDTITMSFIPHNADNYSLYGEPVNITISVISEP